MNFAEVECGPLAAEPRCTSVPLPRVPKDWDFRSISPRRSSSQESGMNVAVVLIAAALAYLFIVGLALDWIRGASHLSMPKPPAREDLLLSFRFPPCSTRLQGDRVAQEPHKR